jgi:hypothetical protein
MPSCQWYSKMAMCFKKLSINPINDTFDFPQNSDLLKKYGDDHPVVDTYQCPYLESRSFSVSFKTIRLLLLFFIFISMIV